MAMLTRDTTPADGPQERQSHRTVSQQAQPCTHSSGYHTFIFEYWRCTHVVKTW
jgi:hypothetical protein